jgi:diaminopimelate decarboxylase
VTTGTLIDPALQPVLPLTATVNAAGRLEIGGCDALDLARDYGTPLYVFDETDLRERCREFRRELEARLPKTTVLYAAKAFLSKAIARLVAEEGLGIDVVSGGELAIALAAGFPAGRIYFPGNNKSRDELREAVAAKVGRVVIDNFLDIGSLGQVAAEAGVRQAVLLRITPDVDPHTHVHLTTGALDSKFGLPLAEGQAEEALRAILATPSLELVGIHIHIGSQIFETEPYELAIGKTIAFAAEMTRYGFELNELSVGGGIGLQYVRGEAPPSVSVYAERIASTLKKETERRGLPLPHLVLEPGRSLVGRAGVALYTVGSRKVVPGVRTFVAVDGGMADNIRPAIYGSRYEAIAAGKPGAPVEETVTVVGKYCESGDILISDIALPRLEAGDILAVPASGAYCLAMASNYNAALRPAVVFVHDGKARLVRRRETYADLLATDLG